MDWLNWMIAVVLAAAVTENYAKKDAGYPAAVAGMLTGALIGLGVMWFSWVRS